MSANRATDPAGFRATGANCAAKYDRFGTLLVVGYQAYGDHPVHFACP